MFFIDISGYFVTYYSQNLLKNVKGNQGNLLILKVGRCLQDHMDFHRISLILSF